MTFPYQKLFDSSGDNFNRVTTFFLIVVAFAFSMAVRFIYVGEIGSIEPFKHNGQIMINNNDGYYFAEGARDILNGHHDKNDLSPIDTQAALLTAGIAKFLPFLSLDTLIFYLPGVLGSLIVIPLILIGRLLGHTFVGFLAALLSGVVWSYYHRTMFGYYDTDMLIIVLPMMMLWGILYSLKEKKPLLFLIPFLIGLYMTNWHGGLYHVKVGFFVMTFVYVAAMDRKKVNLLLLWLLMLPLIKLSPLVIVVIGVVSVFLYSRLEEMIKNFWYFLLPIGIVFVVLVGGEWFYASVLKSGYVNKTEVANEVNSLQFYSVTKTVREAGNISMDTFMNRISGSAPAFFIGILGWILLVLRWPKMIISLPMVVLGFFALKGGLRFTIFACPLMALGNAYFFLFIADKLAKAIFDKEQFHKISRLAVASLFMGLVIYPNVSHVYDYKMPVVFQQHTVKILEKFKEIAKRNDYVMTWWDYGYPIRYYSDVKTFVDGGKHSGEVNYPASYSLCSGSQKASVNMALLDAYFTEKKYDESLSGSYIELMMKHYGFDNTNDFIALLDTVTLPKVKEDIYFFLPYRMINIFPTVCKFSKIDLMTGNMARDDLIMMPRVAGVKNGTIFLQNGWIIKDGILDTRQEKVPLNHVDYVRFTQNQKIDKQTRVYDTRSKMHVIYLQSYGQALILGDTYYNSTYVQLFFLNNYNPNLFEPVIDSPYVRMFKVKKD